MAHEDALRRCLTISTNSSDLRSIFRGSDLFVHTPVMAGSLMAKPRPVKAFDIGSNPIRSAFDI